MLKFHRIFSNCPLFFSTFHLSVFVKLQEFSQVYLSILILNIYFSLFHFQKLILVLWMFLFKTTPYLSHRCNIFSYLSEHILFQSFCLLLPALSLIYSKFLFLVVSVSLFQVRSLLKCLVSLNCLIMFSLFCYVLNR